MAINVGDNFTVRVFCRANNQQNMVNVLHYKVVTAANPLDADLSTFTANLSTAMGTRYKPRLPTTSRYEGLHVTQDTLIPGAVITSQFGSGPGTKAGDPLAPQLSPLVSVRAAGSPTRTRGRIYLPHGTEADEDVDGRMTDAAVTDYNNQASALAAINGISGGLLSMIDLRLYVRRVILGVVSRWQATDWFTRKAYATQRRRSLINRGDANPF